MTLSVEYWPIDKPIPYGRNPRRISEEAIAKVAASIKEFDWQQPIVVDDEGVIIVGHTRLLAARKLGHDTVPVHVARNLTPNQVKAYRLADNRVGEESVWNDSLLKLELADLREMGEDLIVIGFDQSELDAFLVDRDDTPPEDFEEYGDDLEVEHQCPKCGYLFSGGKAKASRSLQDDTLELSDE